MVEPGVDWEQDLRIWQIAAGAALAALAVAVPQLAAAQGQAPAVVAHDYYFQAPDGSRTPASLSITAGGSVSFAYPSGFSQHDVHFTGGPVAPSCVGSTATAQAAFDSPGHSATPTAPGWSGSCSFSAAGDYSFRCSLHPSLMYGVVHVAAASSPGSGSAGGGSPPASPAVSDVAVAAAQRGRAVSGAVTLIQAGSALTVDAYIPHATLAVAHSALVGHVSYASLAAGVRRFRVVLNGAARSALRRRHRLALKLKLTITPPSAPAVVVTRRVTLKP